MGQITKVTPDMIQVANNVTSTTIGNTTSGVSLTFDSNGVITSAANVVLSVANTQLTGLINSDQISSVANTQLTGTVTNAQVGASVYEGIGFRNRIINGDMRIDQRNAGAAVTASGAFPVDRFFVGNGTDGAFSAQQDSSAPTGFLNSIKFTTTTADGTLTTTQAATIIHRIEGTNISDLAWGTANAKTVTLSFWVRSSLTGAFGGSLRNSAANRSYPFTYTISVADTWEQKSVTIPGDTTGTWLTTTGIGINVFFSLAAGPDISGTAGAWAGANYSSFPGAVSVIGTLNATWYITGVQLEVGSVATPFERRPYGTELALCQRYYYKIQAVENYTRFMIGTGDASTSAGGVVSLPVEMRASPTLGTTGTASNYAFYEGAVIPCTSVPVMNSVGTLYPQINFIHSGSIVNGRGYQLLSNNNTTAYLSFSAEL